MQLPADTMMSAIGRRLQHARHAAMPDVTQRSVHAFLQRSSEAMLGLHTLHAPAQRGFPAAVSNASKPVQCQRSQLPSPARGRQAYYKPGAGLRQACASLAARWNLPWVISGA
jgi:hypothetical protein